MGNEMTNLEAKNNVRKKAGIACLCAFLLTICAMLLTSMNAILISFAVLFHISGMVLLFLSASHSKNQDSQNKDLFAGNWAAQYSKNPLDPTNPFYRSRHRL